jgi:DNA-binding transcriptional regulator YbjK
VAAEAGLPLAATTYWFASKEDIVQAAFLRATERDIEYLEALRPQLRTWTRATVARELAAVIDAACTTGRERSVVGYSLWVEALRRPALGAYAERWTAAYVSFYADVLRAIGVTRGVPAAARLLSAAVDGLVAQQLTTDAPLDRAALTRVLAPLFPAAA